MEIVLSQDPVLACEVDPTAYGSMTPSMAATYLRSSHVTTRSFADTLRAMYPHDDLVERLIRFYVIIGAGVNERSLARRFRNWMSDRSHPTYREDLFRVAFALRLTEAQLDYLLGLATSYCIQYRDGRELVLAWFLRNGYGYQEALEFHASLPSYAPQEMAVTGMHTHVTREIQTELVGIRTLDELHEYYLLNMHNFGSQHLRSYFYFERYLAQLVKPTPSVMANESAYSIERVMQEYLSMRVPSTRRRDGLTLAQRFIKSGWPNATTIKDVRNHVIDVPRKLLLLLYVVTENCGILDDGQHLDEYMTLENRVEDHWWTLNAILNDCGMAAIDPRNAFDWLVLYAIAADTDEPMSERMEQVIGALFDGEA